MRKNSTTALAAAAARLYWIRLTPEKTGRSSAGAVLKATRIGHAHSRRDCRYLKRLIGMATVVRERLSAQMVAIIGECRYCTRSMHIGGHRGLGLNTGRGSVFFHKSDRRWRATVYEDGKQKHLKQSVDRAECEAALAEYLRAREAGRA